MIAAVTDIRQFRTQSVKSLYSDFSMNEINGRSFRRDDLFPLDQHQLWSIDEGFVRTVNYSDSGDTVTLGLWGKGNVVGRMLSDNLSYEVECLSRVIAHPIRLSQVDLAEARSHQVEQMETFLNILHCRPLTQRLWMLLSWLSERFAQQNERGHLLDMRLTHQAIAEMIGSTRVTVSRMLKDFETDGKLIRLNQQKLLLLNKF